MNMRTNNQPYQLFCQAVEINMCIPRILLVEDNVLIQKLHHKYLMDMGYQVGVVKNGYEALLCYNDNYHLVLLDIGLPDIDGITVCSTIRDHLSTHQLPIIALTAHGISLKDECLQVGMNEVLAKPISYDNLKAKLEYWLIWLKKNSLTAS